jgi:hypothetical protein
MGVVGILACGDLKWSLSKSGNISQLGLFKAQEPWRKRIEVTTVPLPFFVRSEGLRT